MPYRPHRRTMADGPIQIGEDAPALRHKSPAPAVVVECWCGMVDRMDRLTLDQFTKRVWRKFDPTDLEPLKGAILRRREELKDAR